MKLRQSTKAMQFVLDFANDIYNLLLIEMKGYLNRRYLAKEIIIFKRQSKVSSSSLVNRLTGSKTANLSKYNGRTVEPERSNILGVDEN